MLKTIKSHVYFLLVAVSLVLLAAATAGGVKIGHPATALFGQVVIGAFALYLIRQALPVMLLSVDFRNAGFTGRQQIAKSMWKLLGDSLKARPIFVRAAGCIRDVMVVFYLLLCGLVLVPALYAVAVLLWRVVVDGARNQTESVAEA